MITIDARGKLCPLPLIMLKKELKQATPGSQVAVLTDNATACSNLTDYLSSMNCDTKLTEERGYTAIAFTVPTLAPETCSLPSGTTHDSYVIVIKSDLMGQGDEALGRILMKAFVNAIEEMDVMPTHIILYNKGVFVALEGTDTGASLKKLHEEKGVEVIVCGTCTDYYEIKGQLSVGRISNMYSIMDIQTKAGKIIYP
ncbi:sulfurtransferase-like selenium metabolism protein YedF [Porphyromonas pogonae]|uniref:sulfurtransferase-like selenium metabolism protein YedF n=1 Tax=Porphyromonas pogonae TaxID=867595 RepID=UPI002E78C9B4|nr:sulfurtransferase-like selenium metabolism protein YedF [Porphyromonas pogonae]